MSRVASLLHALGVGTVLDVGANRGQYYQRLRAAGFPGVIVSFEPNPDAYAALHEVGARDPRWRGMRAALGREARPAQLKITRNSEFSSFHPPRSGTELVDGGITVIGVETVSMHSLADLWDALGLGQSRPFLKLDVQGFELEVLEGTGDRLAQLAGIQVEVAIEPLYQGQPALSDVLPYLLTRGFAVQGVLEGYRDQARDALIEVDLLLANRDARR
jgi:FkbM family methyltransferase